MLYQLLKKELMIAMGCTEPAAAALAGAKARQLLGEEALKFKVIASRDMVKNALGVGLPNCDLQGIQAAVALGAAGGEVFKGLAILSDIKEEQKAKALKMDISLELAEEVPPVYISVEAFGRHHYSQAVISGEHTRFSRLVVDDSPLLDLPLEIAREEGEHPFKGVEELTLSEIYEMVEKLEVDDYQFVLQGALTNYAIAQEGRQTGYGLEVGKVMGEGLPAEASNLEEAYRLGSVYAAAASDARMAGLPLPVVINSGSGNQGITIAVPLLIMGKYLSLDEDFLIKGLTLSHLVALVITAKKERLSPLCGAFTAAIGTACGLTYLLGGDVEALDRAVNNMVGNLTGIICDGAKGSCALKIFSSVEAAGMSCRLALKGRAPRALSGIVGKDALQSFANLKLLSHEGMEQTDKTILSIMMEKCER
ncbi:MAG: L-serine ammonia-lyase, iron-sulfur-dependent, subunit alpha [Sphaerochaetaceae bacterium]